MEIEYLYEFTVIAKLESFSRAAEELCISQSSLSKHVLALERELGVPLLIRNSRNVTLSPVGAEILPMAAQVSEIKNKIHVAAARQSSREKAVLAIASIPVMAQYNITGLLAKFQRAFPQVTLEVRESEQAALGELLEKGQCELAFCRRDRDVEETLEMQDFCRDNLVAVVQRSHPLADRNGISLKELKDVPLLFLDLHTGFQHLYSGLFREAGVVPHIVYTGHRPENLMELAAQGMGVALLMRRHTDYIASQNVVCLDILPRVESTVCLARRKGREPSVLVRSFWEFAREHGAEISEPEVE